MRSGGHDEEGGRIRVIEVGFPCGCCASGVPPVLEDVKCGGDVRHVAFFLGTVTRLVHHRRCV